MRAERRDGSDRGRGGGKALGFRLGMLRGHMFCCVRCCMVVREVQVIFSPKRRTGGCCSFAVGTLILVLGRRSDKTCAMSDQ